MMPSIKNAIIFLSIAVVLILVYFFLIKKPAEQSNLQSKGVTVPVAQATPETNSLDKDFLPLLLNVKNIKLEDSIFADKAFQSLTDSSFELKQEGDPGRVNPFAQIGSENRIPFSSAPPNASNIPNIPASLLIPPTSSSTPPPNYTNPANIKPPTASTTPTVPTSFKTPTPPPNPKLIPPKPPLTTQ